jgi:archaellum biogenesis ATPase FlaH
MLIEKPHKKETPKDNFLVQELQFNENQKERFRFLDGVHRRQMRALEENIKSSKELLFNSFSDTTFNATATIDKIGELESKKEEEIYTFFKQVRKLCDEEQAKKFDKIIQKALHKRGPKGRGHKGRRPPPR